MAIIEDLPNGDKYDSRTLLSTIWHVYYGEQLLVSCYYIRCMLFSDTVLRCMLLRCCSMLLCGILLR